MATDQSGQVQRDVQFLERVQRDVVAWQAQGIITPEQERRILDYYQVTQGVLRRGRTYARLVAALATLGAILVGTGAILFFASNWQAIPLYGKLALMVVGVSGANAGGYWLKYRGGYPSIGGAVLFLAAIFFGAGIFLTTQAYHVNANNPDLLFWWGLGVLPAAYVMRSRTMLVLALGIGLVWPGWKMGLALQGRDAMQAAVALYLTLGPALYALGALHGRFTRTASFGIAYIGLGLLATLGALYVFSFEDVWRDSSRIGPLWGQGGGIPLVVISALVAVAVAGVAATLVLDRRRRASLGLLPYEAAALLLPIGLAYLALGNPSLHVNTYVAIFNLALFAAIIATAALGILQRRPVLVNLGLAAFVLVLVTRYADLVWGMLDTSLFFTLGGVLLLGGGFLLERARRRLLVRFNLMETAS